MSNSPIAQRLREYHAYCPQTDNSKHSICDEAANTIDALCETLRKYAEDYCEYGVSNAGCGKFSADICAGCDARAAIAKAAS